MEEKILIKKIYKEVIDPGNCFHCGLCEGLSDNLFRMVDTNKGPTPKLNRKPVKSDINCLKKILIACPGRGVPYNFLSNQLKTKKKSKIVGNYNSLFIASSNSNQIREKASSGGLVRTLLVELIKSKEVDYVYALDEKANSILTFDPKITDNTSEILSISQSIYQTTSFLHKIKKLKKNKTYVFVGTPEQIAPLRILKTVFPKEFQHIKYLIGIYAGTNMYPGAINFYLQGNGIKKISEIKKIFWRYGEWPGELRIVTKNNKTFSLKKFYYNYLIPFFISKNCLMTPDFTSELSDISIGDAWSPKLENKGHGYSVVVTRSKKFDYILNKLEKKKNIYLKKISLNETIKMHAHMIEFKKIGSYLRIKKFKEKGPVPQYDLKPIKISILRRIIEMVIGGIILISSNNYIQKIFSLISSKFLGHIFKVVRQFWKFISKTTKRKGLAKLKFVKVENQRLKEFY